MGLTTRVGVQTHHRPSNYDGPWPYFENYGSIAPTARYLPNFYGILVFLLGSSVKAQLYVVPPCLQEIGGEKTSAGTGITGEENFLFSLENMVSMEMVGRVKVRLMRTWVGKGPIPAPPGEEGWGVVCPKDRMRWNPQ